MKKYRICTTISTEHAKLLKNYTEKLGTQQKALELALENLRKEEQTQMLSQEELLWLRMHKELKPIIVCIHKDIFLEMLKTNSTERIAELFTKLNLAEHQVVYYYQRPLKELSLKEVMDGIVITTKMVGLLDTLDYSENTSHYSLKATHSCGGTVSYLFKIFFENLFKAYGVKTNSTISQHSIFIRIFKKRCDYTHTFTANNPNSAIYVPFTFDSLKVLFCSSYNCVSFWIPCSLYNCVSCWI